MQVSIDRSDSSRLSFKFTPEENDAVPPLSELWFSSDHISKVRSDRLALMAYFAAKPFLGNNLALVGAEFPAYMAAGVNEEFGACEFFVSPIENRPRRIMHGRVRIQEWALCEIPDSKHDSSMLVSRTPYGYDLTGAVKGRRVPVHSNLRFFCSFHKLEGARHERAILATLICDLYDGYQLAFDGEDDPELAEILNLLSLAGISRAVKFA